MDGKPGYGNAPRRILKFYCEIRAGGLAEL